MRTRIDNYPEWQVDGLAHQLYCSIWGKEDSDCLKGNLPFEECAPCKQEFFRRIVQLSLAITDTPWNPEEDFWQVGYDAFDIDKLARWFHGLRASHYHERRFGMIKDFYLCIARWHQKRTGAWNES